MKRFLSMKIEAGFTLLELLAAILVMSVLLALCVPAVSSVKGGMELRVASSEVMSRLELARQAARTASRKTELRLYREGGAESPYRSMQVYRRSLDAVSAVPADRKFRLPDSVAISENAIFSSLLSQASIGSDENGPYAAIVYLPDGTPDAAISTVPVLTLLGSNADRKSDVLPSNFVTIQIDPQTGRARYFRP